MQQGKQIDFWELLPHKGLGPIRFSMDKSEVQCYYKEFGTMIFQKDESIEQKKKDLEDTFKQFSEFFSEEDLKIAMQGLEDVGGELGDVVTEYTSSGISLQYKADRLTEIFADDRAKQLHFQGIPIFSDDPTKLFNSMRKVFEEDPVIKDKELIFRNNNIYLFNFIKEDSTGNCVTGDQQNRTIMWRDSPRPLSVDLAEYRHVKLPA
ncbi:hypothetical protein ACQ7CX_11630 [Chryseobacterium arthrosphaerae]|uniref:hypothetical protein n=1 Tax=Chryseobacterium arthrosphaerae TaxID=651561 RepID=UPI001BAF6770|nr:hypothetical protein [Chryseobacterium arthrosphaerae]QUY54087.1 hypothetical protein I2F65_14465 [Chryseobacterium arthrosphaerae]